MNASCALFELERQGLHRAAQEAEITWSRGEKYYLDLDPWVHVPRRIISDIEEINRAIIFYLRH